MDKIGGIGGNIGGEQSQKIRETLRDRADQMIQKTAGAGGGDASPAQVLDANQISDEAFEQLSGAEEKGNADVDSLLKSILDMKSQDKKSEEDAGQENAAEEGAQTQQNQQTQAAGDKKQAEEVKVEWQPLVKEGDIVQEGQPWGHFTVTREKKDVENKKDAGGNEGAAPQQAAQQNNAGAGKNVKNAAKAKEPKPVEEPGKQGGQDKGATWKVGEGGKPSVIDQGTGEKMEIPDNGELKATHPMKITNIGKTGELKGGDELFTYQKPSQEELEQSKKAKEQGKEVKEIDEAKAQGDQDKMKQ